MSVHMYIVDRGHFQWFKHSYYLRHDNKPLDICNEFDGITRKTVLFLYKLYQTLSCWIITTDELMKFVIRRNRIEFLAIIITTDSYSIAICFFVSFFLQFHFSSSVSISCIVRGKSLPVYCVPWNAARKQTNSRFLLRHFINTNRMWMLVRCSAVKLNWVVFVG